MKPSCALRTVRLGAVLTLLLIVLVPELPGCAASRDRVRDPDEIEIAVTSVAVRVHGMDAMEAFYREAFGVRFRDVRTGPLRSRFGTVGNLTLKFVPLRQSSDFEGFPSHQLGFEVPDVGAVIDLALEHGGRQEGGVVERDGRLHGAVRDPDGNTIELYGPITRSAEPPRS